MIPIAIGASASASPPGSTMVSPGRASASTQGGHPRAGDGDVQPDAARGGLAPQFLADDPRRPEQPLEAADVDRHQIVAVPLVARRELLRDRCERADRAIAGLQSAPSGRRRYRHAYRGRD